MSSGDVYGGDGMVAAVVRDGLALPVGGLAWVVLV